MTTISERQQAILKFIASRKGFPPSIREIQKAVGAGSPSTIFRDLEYLEGLGLVTRSEERQGRGGNRTQVRRNNRCVALCWERLPEDLKLCPPGGVPVLGEIIAGEPIDSLAFPRDEAEEWVQVSLRISSGDLRDVFALRVKGESMKDASVLPGDVVVLRSNRQVNQGDMVAAWLVEENLTTLKHFYQHGDEVRLEPANPDYPPILCRADNVQVQGKVIEVIRQYD